VRLEVRLERLFGCIPGLSSLPKVPAVPYWDYYEIHSNQPDAVLKPLSEAGGKNNIFTEAMGFFGMSLDKKSFKFTFHKGSSINTGYVKSILEAASRLAVAFS